LLANRNSFIEKKRTESTISSGINDTMNEITTIKSPKSNSSSNEKSIEKEMSEITTSIKSPKSNSSSNEKSIEKEIEGYESNLKVRKENFKNKIVKENKREEIIKRVTKYQDTNEIKENLGVNINNSICKSNKSIKN